MTQIEVKVMAPLVIPPEMPSLARVLWEARQYLSSEDHWSHGRERDGAKKCVIAAIYEADSKYIGVGALGNLSFGASEVLRKSIGINTMLAHWNDAPERKFSEVADAFDRAIASALEKGI